MIGDIEVSIESIRGDRVRVGISAPIKVPVHRKEVWEQIKQQEAAEAARLAALPSAPKPKTASPKKPTRRT